MTAILVVIFILFILAVIAVVIISRNSFSVQPENLDLELTEFKEAYFAKDKLMNQSELSFYLELKKQLPDKYEVFTKVRMEDFIGVHKNNERLAHFRGYIRSRHVDFLICEKYNHLKPVIAIELDGSFHRTAKAKEVDERKDKIYEAVRLRLERIKVGEDFSEIIRSLNL